MRYGTDPQQFGDLRIPKGEGPHPVLVVIHGGCWMSKFADLNFMSPFSEAFTKKGIATWNIEYRCIDHPGGGWPGTFKDVGDAIDYLRTIASKYQLDLNRVAIIGHSAGGHLALWSASRHHLPKSSDLYSEKILSIKGVINLAGPGNLKSFIPMQEDLCDDKVISKLLGSDPAKIAERNAQGSPYEMLPLGTKQILITGTHDPAFPPILAREYQAKAKEVGEQVTVVEIDDASHFEVIAPDTKAWSIVEEAVFSLIS